MEAVRLYVLESYNELLNKVTWPTWPALINTSVVVVIGSIILTLIIFVFDLISRGMTGFFYNLM